MTHYRIRYCDLEGKDVPVYEAKLYRIFLHGNHVLDFQYLSVANEWVKARQGGAA
jgi:hypothetical protein